MRKRGTIENQDLQKEVRDRFGLPQQEVSEIASKFQRYDSLKTGYIGKHELDDVMRDLGLLQNERVAAYLLDEIKESGLKNFDFLQVCHTTCKLKLFIEKLEDDESITGEYNPIVDVFVAMGGNYDKTGYVNKEAIINIIKSEFELTFDMERLLNSIGSNNKLDFQEFCQVFENAGDDGRSVITTISERVRKPQVDDEDDSFKVRYKDFERWCKQMQT